MVNVRNPFRRQDSFSGAMDPHALAQAPVVGLGDDELAKTPTGEKSNYDGGVHDAEVSHADYLHVAQKDILANGKERPIETAEDIATRCMSLDDDPEMAVHTFRMYFLGLGLTCFSAVLGQIFYFRPQTVYVSQLFLQIIAFILGRLWHQILPGAHRGKFWKFLNPCEFTLKEHVAILIMSSTSASSAEAISVFAADELYYNITPNYGVAIFTLLGSQLFGYGLAGLTRSFTVFPTYIVYPNLVPTVNLFDALHRDKDVNAQKKRLRMFWIVFIVIFCWEWIPEFVAPTLTGISIFCLARRNSAWFTRIFGGSNGNEGLGMFSFCFDWNYVGSGSSCLSSLFLAIGTDRLPAGLGGGSLGALFTPFTTQVSQYIGVGLCCILSCAWNAQNFPFLSQELFYENGTTYDQSLILNPDYSLNETGLAEQGIPWYAPTNAVYYLGCNLAIGATLTHVGASAPDLFVSTGVLTPLLASNLVCQAYHRSLQALPRPHAARPALPACPSFSSFNYVAPVGQTDDLFLIAQMLKYKEVPMWVYGFTLIASFAMAMATCCTSKIGLSSPSPFPSRLSLVVFALRLADSFSTSPTDTGHSQLPWWALIVALLLSLFMFPFVCVIYAVTGFKTDVQQLAQMLGAALVPGNSQANMYFTLYGYNSCAQALSLGRDLKLGQYTKLPPRATFGVQTIGTVVGSILQLIIMKSVINSQREILESIQGSNIWSGQQVQSFNSQAVAWGALAKHMYGPGSTYFIIPLAIIIGLAVPLPFFFAHKFFPKYRFDTIVTPIVCWCLGYLSVGINSSIFMTMLLGLFSQFYLRRFRSTWFRKYNYLVSAGLDGGTQCESAVCLPSRRAPELINPRAHAVMVFIASFALFGAAGSAQTMPEWALNPSGNYDCLSRLDLERSPEGY
ncbi:SPOSA6832_02564 [Sporobolomyces salmonicolor]|uniref:SPOSA6832_02564-mRNA-1:cds n=1 Tax=Sporidiobolus salmonicolor TaxID=5005 RepID=A0A0D6ELM8_SPOSA|nr:SPOSA6832_02564 [Sporobolomyces salmonicolor]